MSIPTLDHQSDFERDEQLPDWPALEPQAEKSSFSRSALLKRAAMGVLVAAILWALGLPMAAFVLLAVLLVATVASLLSTSVAPSIGRAERTVQRAVGRALTVLVLGLAQLFVFIPLW